MFSQSCAAFSACGMCWKVNRYKPECVFVVLLVSHFFQLEALASTSVKLVNSRYPSITVNCRIVLLDRLIRINNFPVTPCVEECEKQQNT